MSKGIVIYYSNTGNTEIMANGILEGMKSNVDQAEIFSVELADKDMVGSSDFIAIGCPACGAEELDDEYMVPFIESLESLDFTGKKVGLFGSYDWGDGEWMEEWHGQLSSFGANLLDEDLIIQLTPDNDGIKKCQEFGAQLSK